MAAAKKLDDPDQINAFLAMIGGSPIAPRVVKTVQSEEDNQPGRDDQAMIEVIDENEKPFCEENSLLELPSSNLNKNNTCTVTPEVGSRAHSTASSPSIGTKAPPQTPITTAVTSEEAVKLEPIEEDETDILLKLADESKLGLGDSKFACKSGLRYPVGEFQPGTLSSTAYNQRTPGRTDFTASALTQKIKKETAIDNPPQDYIEGVVSQFQMAHMNNFKKDKEPAKEQGQPSRQLPDTDSMVVSIPAVATMDEYEATTPIKTVEKVSQDVKTGESKTYITSSVTAKDETGPNKTRGAVISTVEQKTSDLEEDREHLTHFKSWGKPEARDKPAARVRRVTLSSLPAHADLTLVQSLVHGGAIDDLILMGPSGVAYVRFVSADACDRYCDKYPNGLTFKYRGRPCTIFVDKCKDVDVISGRLQGYIDCGASRCVRAIGADEGWGMGALRKLAEGKTRKGKVENITDVYRNEVRTIVFRFTSIGEAVTFKGVLIRHEDWEACNIQFAADPCEKDNGVHLE